MLHKYNSNKLRFYLVFLFVLIVSCSKSVNDKDKEELLKEKPWNPNVMGRSEEARNSGGGFFNSDRKNEGKTGGVFEFASSNVLWRATLKSLDFLPLLNADYSGGVIIYDWYSQTNNPKEQIKISVQFLNNELRSDSIKITAHKKICETLERCSNSTLDRNFANSIKDSIMASARTLRIEETKKEKK
jgi:hypothetical protein